MSVVRIVAEGTAFDPLHPYDANVTYSARGTGFLVDVGAEVREFGGRPRPVIVTCHHVVENADRVLVTSIESGEGESLDCKVVAMNPHLDVALLEMEGVGVSAGMQCYRFCDYRTSELCPKVPVSVIGFANGTIRVHTTTGTISGRLGWPHNRWQTDATINAGNSGSPVLDGSGSVVGLCTSGESDMDNTNFFLGSDEIRCFLRRAAKARDRAESPPVFVDHGYHLDASVTCVNSGACAGETGGVLVRHRRDGIGLERGDVITKCEDPRGDMVVVDVRGRIRAPSVYAADGVDFRTVLDNVISPRGDSFLWRLVVRTADGEEVSRWVTCGKSELPWRAKHADCERVQYVQFGGLILRELDVDVCHARPALFPLLKIASANGTPVVVCTKVLPGSPFARSDGDIPECSFVASFSVVSRRARPRRKRERASALDDAFRGIGALFGGKGATTADRTVNVRGLRDVESLLSLPSHERDSLSVVFDFSTGQRVGCALSEAIAYRTPGSADETGKSGPRSVGRGHLADQ